MTTARRVLGATRRVGPFVLALVLVGWVLSGLDVRSLGAAFQRVRAGPYVLFTALFVVALLGADALASLPPYRRVAPTLGLRELFVVRGASYLWSIVNHHAGQVWLTLLLSERHRAPLASVAGATLLCYASWAGALLGLGALGVILSGKPIAWAAAILAAGLLYLGLLALRPAALARVRLLAPLFDAGVSGHLVALAARLPHAAVLFLGTWLPFALFGVELPPSKVVAYVPLLMVASTLPLTPQGFGTRDALAAALLSPYAPGETEAERLAVVAAVTTSFGVLVTLVDAVVGLALTPAARRTGSAARPGTSRTG